MSLHAFEDIELGRFLKVKSFPFPRRNIEPGYVIIDLKSEIPFTERDIFICTRFDNLPKYSILNICSNEPIPNGWKQKASFPSIYCSKEKSGTKGRRKPIIKMLSWNNEDLSLENGKLLYKNIDCGEVNLNFIDLVDKYASDKLNIIAILDNGQLVHTIKYRDDYWGPYKNINRLTNTEELEFKAISIELIGQELHLFAISKLDKMYHTLRTEDGDWKQFRCIDENIENKDLELKSIAVENVNDNIHIRCVDNNNDLWQAVMYDDDEWHTLTKDLIIDEKEIYI